MKSECDMCGKRKEILTVYKDKWYCDICIREVNKNQVGSKHSVRNGDAVCADRVDNNINNSS